VALLSVQALYYNALSLLALCAGAAAVGLQRRNARLVAAVGALGLVCAGSLLPYADVIRRLRQWNALVQFDLGAWDLVVRFQQVVAGTGAAAALWPAILTLAVAGCVGRLVQRQALVREREAGAFLGVTMSVGVAAHVVFLLTLGYMTQPWYYLALMALVAVLADAALRLLEGSRPIARVARLGIFVLLAIGVAGNAWRGVAIRQTNVDRAARALEALAAPGDLVVVNPWWYGVTFQRYYSGRAPWTTLPEMGDHRVHRYDIVKRAMEEPGSVAPLLARVAATLDAGGRVWVVGDLALSLSTDPPRWPAPAPGLPTGWNEMPYLVAWSRHAAWVLRTRAVRVAEVLLPQEGPVSAYEHATLLVAYGPR
jgi:hypothetical protein